MGGLRGSSAQRRSIDDVDTEVLQFDLEERPERSISDDQARAMSTASLPR